MTLREAPLLKDEVNIKPASSNTYNEKFCDFTLKCNDGIGILVHRVILANNSDVFNDLFTSAMDENKSFVEIDEIDSNTMKSVLDFIYTGCVDMEQANISSVLNAAEHLKLDVLKSKCAEKLVEDVDSHNVIKLLTIATYAQKEASLSTDFEDKCLAIILL